MVKKVDLKTVTNGERGGPTSEWHVFYDLTASVGRGGGNGKPLVNHRDDVMLVQYMLRKYYKRASLTFERSALASEAASAIATSASASRQ